jgi:parvulin-like peptidyl-prolyl isomerase
LAKKRIKPELGRPPTKRQLSKWQRQKRTQRIIVIVGAIFIALVVGYIGYGYYDEQVKPLHQPVMKIDDTVFDMDYYVKLLELYSQGKDATETWDVADDITRVIGSGEAVMKVAADVGYGVSADEVDSELESLGLPDDKVYRDAVTSKILAARLFQNYFDPMVPTECEQVQVQAIFVESEEVAEKLTGMLKAGDNFTALANRYSVEATTKEKGGDLGWLPKDFAYVILGNLGDSLLKDVPFELEPGVLSEPIYDSSVTKGIGYWLMEVTEQDEQKGKHARGILLGSLQEAEEIRARIEAGDDFGDLAKEYSQHLFSKGQGGDLGWTEEWGFGGRIALGLAMQLDPGILSQPTADDSVETKGGYWLIKVVDKDDSRVLDEETRNTVKLSLFEDLLIEQSEKLSVEMYLTEDQKSWAVDRVLEERE